jgi:glycine/D-amino acid oxidase-like deaminating enzyme
MSPRRALDLRFRPWNGPPHVRSLWIEEALAKENAPQQPAFAGDEKADICIIGGGYTGLWTAIRVREQDAGARIIILEADICGGGASGRNSGGMGHWWSKLPTLVKLLNKDDALLVLKKSVDIVDDIHDFVTREGIPCDIRRGTTAWTATSKAQLGAWDTMLRVADQMGLEAPYRTLTTDEMKQFGQGPYLAGIMEGGAMRVQPAHLARGLRRIAMARGIEIFENTPVIRVASEDAGVTVETKHGRISAGQVVFAANAWMAHLPQFRSSIVVVSSDIIVTDPIPDIIKERGLANRPGSRNSRLMLNYGGRSPDGRVYLGRGGGSVAYDAHIGPEFAYSETQAREVESDFRYLYPELSDVPIARGWAGPIDRSVTALPWFGQLEDERIHYAIGYSGHGVAASAIGGRALASRLLGRQDEWTAAADCLLRARHGRFPPEPLRYIGGALVRRAVARKELTENAGREPSWIDKKLTEFAPATIVDARLR